VQIPGACGKHHWGLKSYLQAKFLEKPKRI